MTVTEQLKERAREVQSVLTDAANATGAPAPIFEPLGLERETPLLDVPPLTLDVNVPVWARASRHLFHRWITERVDDKWRRPVEQAVEAYLDVLRRWAADGLGRLRREFEGQSRPLLTHLTGSSDRSTTTTSTPTAIRRDLDWLHEARAEMTHVRD